ncbi:MAG: hypothetical protein H6Q69_963 [Firmicutes bacterium]|nr:hypothetical protein [Bacillota bacterium]
MDLKNATISELLEALVARPGIVYGEQEINGDIVQMILITKKTA